MAEVCIAIKTNIVIPEDLLYELEKQSCVCIDKNITYYYFKKIEWNRDNEFVDNLLDFIQPLTYTEDAMYINNRQTKIEPSSNKFNLGYEGHIIKPFSS